MADWGVSWGGTRVSAEGVSRHRKTENGVPSPAKERGRMRRKKIPPRMGSGEGSRTSPGEGAGPLEGLKRTVRLEEVHPGAVRGRQSGLRGRCDSCGGFTKGVPNSSSRKEMGLYWLFWPIYRLGYLKATSIRTLPVSI